MSYLIQYLLQGEVVSNQKFKKTIYPKIVEFMFTQNEAPEYYDDLGATMGEVINNFSEYEVEVLNYYLEDYLGIKCNQGYDDEWMIGNIILKKDEIKAVEEWNFVFDLPSEGDLNKNRYFFEFIGLNVDKFKLSVSTEVY